MRRRVCLLLARRVPPVPSPLLLEVADRLRRLDVDVVQVIAEEVLTRPDVLVPDADLYLLKSHTELSLSLASVLHDQGARIVNPYPACALVQDKLRASRRLAAAGLPVPPCWTTADLGLLAPLLADGPLVVKPARGHRGMSVHLVRTTAELAALPVPAHPVIVQRHVPGPVDDLKVYAVGRAVFVVRKPFSSASFSVPGRPGAVSAEVRDITRRCGEVFGLGLYGIDVIESPDGPVIVDLNTFPGYKGVPDVAPLVTDHVLSCLAGDAPTELPTVPVLRAVTGSAAVRGG